MKHRSLDTILNSIPGPVLVIGAGGFIGANLLRAVLGRRDDVYGTVRSEGLWRLEDIPAYRILAVNLLDLNSTRSVLHKIKPATIFNCSSFGAYSFERDVDLIHRTNYLSLIQLLELVSSLDVRAYIHAGSSSEYGLNSNAPSEDALMLPDSHYAVSKASGALAVAHYGKVRGLPCVNLRLYSAYGPYEDSSRLIPAMALNALKKTYPPLVNAAVSRDFIHVDDIVRAFALSAAAMGNDVKGESFNVGTGASTSIGELAVMVQELFKIEQTPEFDSMPSREWDRVEWRADTKKAEELLGFKAEIDLRQGLATTVAWWEEFLRDHSFESLTKKKRKRTNKTSLSIVVSCHNNAKSLPDLYAELIEQCTALKLDHELVFVDDGSTDETSETIRQLSDADPRVVGVVHSRQFGAEASYRSGMEAAGKEGVVLMRAGFTDPPGLISDFIAQWRAGADIVTGRRLSRELPWWARIAHSMFHRLISVLSDVPMEHDASDFCLLDARTARWILRCTEFDAYLRGLRGYVGFKQAYVDYKESPSRKKTYNLRTFMSSLRRSKRTFFSYTKAPLSFLTLISGCMFLGMIVLGSLTLYERIFNLTPVPRGTSLVILLLMIFGTANLFAVSILGEYIGKIIDEVRRRPQFIRTATISRGEYHILPEQSDDSSYSAMFAPSNNMKK